MRLNDTSCVVGQRLRSAFAGAVLAAGLVGAPAAMAADVQRGGTVTVADWLAAPSLDPHLSNSTGGLWTNMFDALFTYTPATEPGESFTITPGLATSYERVSDTVIEVSLREGVVFHDGTPFDAEAAKWNLERARDNEASTRKQTVEDITGITVVDDHTLRLEFETPQPLFDVLMSRANPLTIYFVSPAAVESMSADEFARKPVGTGPFTVVEWLPDDRIIMEAFDDHWQEGEDGEPLPYVDDLVVRFIPDQSVGALELRAGSLQMATLLAQDVAALRNSSDIALYNLPVSDKAFPSFYITSSPDSSSPFASDVRLRRAVQHAIDRNAMAQALGFGNAEAHYHWGWYPGVPGYDETLPRYEYDPEKARALLAEAGYPDGIELSVKVINRPSDVPSLEVMQAMLAQVGIKLNIVLLDRTPWVDDGRSGNFEALSHGNTANIEPLMRQQTRTGSSANWAGYSNPDVDALWDDAAKATTVEERADIYREMQRIMHDDAYHVIGFRAPLVQGHSVKLHGMEKSAGENLRYLWLEQ